MIKKNIFILITFVILLICPHNIHAMAAPAAMDCDNTGGTYKILTDSEGSQSGTCIFPGGIECSDYDTYKGNGCLGQYLLFGSLHWWPTRIIYILVILSLVYLIIKKIKHKK